MENFNWTTFTRKIIVKAPAEVLYNAWAIPNEIERWFLSKTSYYKSDGEIKDKNEAVEADDRYEWNWFLYEGTERNEIIEVNGKDYIQFKFAGECIVEVRIKALDDVNTLVEITQSNIPTDDQSKENIRLGCESGWAFYLVNLKSVYEGGLDLRNKEIDLKNL